jgi:hypothetical protein
VVLVAVGTGDEVDGAGAGLVVGGARGGWVDAAGAPELGCGAGLADALGWLPDRPADCDAGCVLAVPCGVLPDCPGDRDVVAAALAAPAAPAAPVAPVAPAGAAGGCCWTFAAGACAVRAKTIAKPTVASAPS